MRAFDKTTDVPRFVDWVDLERMTARPCVATQPGLIRNAADGMLRRLGFRL
jgi:cardiolipin synthase A/B